MKRPIGIAYPRPVPSRAPSMKTMDAVGYLAAGLVLATFCMRSMSSLRLVALASNLAFIAYGYLGNLTPVLLLHALLPARECLPPHAIVLG